MYCTRCDAYIPSGLDLLTCPACEVDIVNVAIPRENREATVVAVEEPPPPASVEEKSLWRLFKKLSPPSTPTPAAKAGAFKRPRPMTEYQLFHAMIFSFFSPSFYYDVAKRWRGACIVHLSLVAVIASLFFTFWTNEQYTAWHYEYLYPTVGKFPSIAVQDGRMMMLEPSPHVLVAKFGPGEDNTQRLIFDSAGTASANQLTSEWLISPSAIFFKDAQQMLKSFPFDPQYKFKLNREILYWGIEEFRRWTPFLTYWLISGFYWCFLLAGAFFYSLPGILINTITRNGLDYPSIFRLSALAITPAALTETIVRIVLNADMPLLKILFLIIPLVYLILAGISVRWFLNKQAEMEAKHVAQKPAKKRIFYDIVKP